MILQYNEEDYVICSTLGSCFGDRGTVLLAKRKKDSHLFASKRINLEEITQDDYDLLRNEVVCMRQLIHPNILPCVASFVFNSDLYIFSPLIGYGSCHDLIATHFQYGLPEVVVASFLRDVLHALDYIHSKGYIHRTVKGRHILVNSDGRACLSGFQFLYYKGFSAKRIHDFPIAAARNLNWLSPEILGQNLEGYDEKSDVYSVGITACELANGIVPFSEAPSTLMLMEKLRGVTPLLMDTSTWNYYDDFQQDDRSSGKEGSERSSENEKQNLPPRFSRTFSKSFHAFVELCVQHNSDARPYPKQLVNHSFFKQVRKLVNSIPELLEPAVSLTESSVTELEDDITMIEDMNQRLSSCTLSKNPWDFDNL